MKLKLGGNTARIIEWSSLNINFPGKEFLAVRSDIQRYRQRRQAEADRRLEGLLAAFKAWKDENTNLREKVRAKHLFAEQTGLAVEQVEKKPWDMLFEEWFSYDYVTIIGTHLFDMFLKQTLSARTRMDLQLGGLLLTASWLPVELNEKNYWVRAVGKQEFSNRLQQDAALEPVASTTWLVRTARVGFEDTRLGQAVPLRPAGEDFQALMLEAEKAYQKEEHIRWHKEKGASWLQFALPSVSF